MANIPDSLLEDFRCSICTRYLSCAPVQLLPDGRSICNLCSLSTEELTYRQLMFETFLSKLSFPCQFENYGCEERMPFGQANEHEDNCAFRTYMCPIVPNDICAWKGPAVEIADHFAREHFNVIKERAEFKLRVDQNQQGILMVTVEGVEFIIKYMYDASTYNLQCDVRYLISNVQEGFYKIQLTSDSDNDYSVTLKGGNCLSYDGRFYDMEDSKILILNNCMQVLNNPDCVIVAINVIVTKLRNGNAFVERCRSCQGYLISRLFKNTYGSACYRCHIKYNYAEKLKELYKYGGTEDFPCRWRNCKFIGKAKDLLKHDLSCQFRIHNCMDCEKPVAWECLMDHLQRHRNKYLRDTYVYKIIFNEPYLEKKIFTFKDNEVIFIGQGIRHWFDAFNKTILYIHDIDLYSTDSVKVTAKFEHAHCKLKWKIYIIPPPGAYFDLDDFPTCFKNDEEITVTLKIISSSKNKYVSVSNKLADIPLLQ